MRSSFTTSKPNQPSAKQAIKDLMIYIVKKITLMATTKITVNNNGSLRVEGDFEIVDKEGRVYGLGGRQLVSLCRCGLSNTKPFCDGSHKGHLEHEAIAFDLPPKKPA